MVVRSVRTFSTSSSPRHRRGSRTTAGRQETPSPAAWRPLVGGLTCGPPATCRWVRYGDESESSPLAADRLGGTERRQPRCAPDPARGHVDELHGGVELVGEAGSGFRVDPVRHRQVQARIAGDGIVRAALSSSACIGRSLPEVNSNPAQEQPQESTYLGAPQGDAQSRFRWSRAGFGVLTQAQDGEQEVWAVADLPYGGGDPGVAGLSDQPDR